MPKSAKRRRIRTTGSQARSVGDGLLADVVTLAMWADVDSLRQKKLIDDGWEKEFDNNSLPYTSTIVFVVRKGNPFGIRDWPDLVERDQVQERFMSGYADVIVATKIHDVFGKDVHFEIFREDHKPPLTDLFDGQRDDMSSYLPPLFFASVPLLREVLYTNQ